MAARITGHPEGSLTYNLRIVIYSVGRSNEICEQMKNEIRTGLHLPTKTGERPHVQSCLSMGWDSTTAHLLRR